MAGEQPAEIRRRVRWVRLLPALLWQALIWLLSSRPWPGAGGFLSRLWLELPEWVRGVLPADKVVHAAFYAILAWLWAAGLPRRRRVAAAWLLTSAWGALDEVHQSYVPGRTADPWDLLADMTGAALALLWLTLWLRRRDRREPTE